MIIITVSSALRLGYRMVAKNKSLVYLLGGWELVKSLIAYLAIEAGLALPLWPGFRLEVPIPRLWPSADMVFSHPYLNLNSGYLLKLIGTDKFYGALALGLGVLLLDTLVKTVFIGQLIAIFQGKELDLHERWIGVTRSFNRYFILAWCLVIWQMVGNVISPLGMTNGLIFRSISIIGAVLFVFVDIAIQYHDLSIVRALRASIIQHRLLGEKGLAFLLVGALLLGCMSIPLNWSVGFYPALMLGILVFAILGALLSAGILYLYTAKEQVEQQM